MIADTRPGGRAEPPGARRTGGIALGDLAASIARSRGDAIVVTGPGAVAGALYVADPDSPSIYNMELAYATPMALGIALRLPDRPVISVEGDGSMLAGLGVLATIARYRPPNLTVVVIENGIYGTGDNSVLTPSGIGADLAAVALALGWTPAEVVRVADASGVDAALSASRDGPRLVVADVDPASYAPSAGRAKPGVDVADSAALLRRHLQRRGSPR